MKINDTWQEVTLSITTFKPHPRALYVGVRTTTSSLRTSTITSNTQRNFSNSRARTFSKVPATTLTDLVWKSATPLMWEKLVPICSNSHPAIWVWMTRSLMIVSFNKGNYLQGQGIKVNKIWEKLTQAESKYFQTKLRRMLAKSRLRVFMKMIISLLDPRVLILLSISLKEETKETYL